MIISSLQNPLVKYVLKLKRKAAFRKKESRFVVEGLRENERAIRGGFRVEKWIVCPEILPEIPAYVAGEVYRVTPVVYEHLAYRGGTEGLIGIYEMKDFGFVELETKNPFVLIAEGIQKPGNAGALLRTADGAGTDAVIFVNPATDLYNPNVIRASLGTLFTQTVMRLDLEGMRRFKEVHDLRIFAATLQNSRIYWKENFKGAVGIAVGEEAHGLSEAMRRLSDQAVYIPMNGIADSLNVSVAAGILVYEALRQRSVS